MEIVETVNKMKEIAQDVKNKGKNLGLVPTMGYLHKGHLSLVRMSRGECSSVVVSVFINPTQFGPGEDFNKYPRDFNRDYKVLKKERVDYVFHPDASEMYGEGYKTFVEVKELGDIMCGKFRPNHFRGVCTVVLKLFNIVHPDRAYFGEKDYQQLVIIKKMVEDLNLNVKVVGGPTIREKDGLALSSRNKYLSYEERKNATILYKCLNYAQTKIKEGEEDLLRLKDEILKMLSQNKYVKKVDYFDFRDPKTLEEKKRINYPRDEILAATAAWVGDTRLIDNKILLVENK